MGSTPAAEGDSFAAGADSAFGLGLASGGAAGVLGAGGVGMGDDAAMGGLFHKALLSSPAGRIAGGTDEVMKNILAERVLGLPGDARADKGVPFNKIPNGPKG